MTYEELQEQLKKDNLNNIKTLFKIRILLVREERAAKKEKRKPDNWALQLREIIDQGDVGDLDSPPIS